LKIAVFSTKPYDRESLDRANEGHGHDLSFFEPRISPATAVLAEGFDSVCPFVNDDLGREVVATLAEAGVRLLTLRSAGFNHVDLQAAADHGMTVARVPAYSPHAVAEHAAGLVYEEEADLFFEDLSDTVIQDDVFARLLTFPNVVITGHQGFFTREALDQIAESTLANATAFETGSGTLHEVILKEVTGARS